jgi:hypothetical protein
LWLARKPFEKIGYHAVVQRCLAADDIEYHSHRENEICRHCHLEKTCVQINVSQMSERRTTRKYTFEDDAM